MPEFPVVTLTPEPFAHLTMTAPISGIPQVMGEGFGKLASAFAQSGARIAGMPMCHYIAYDGKTTTFELGFPARPDETDRLAAAGLQIGETPSGRLMRGIHVGPYDKVVETYDAMTGAMAARTLKGASDMWEVYHSPPETPPERLRTEVLWPVH